VFVGGDDLTGALYAAPVVSATSIIHGSNKIPNRDVLVLANADPSGKRPLKCRERPSVSQPNTRGTYKKLSHH